MTAETDFPHEHLVSSRAASRETVHFSRIAPEGAPKGFVPHEKPLYLSYGTPNVGYFPVDSIEVTVKEAPFQADLGFAHTNNSLETLSKDLKKLDIDISKSKKKVEIVKINEDPKAIDIQQGFQYSDSTGMPQLSQFTRDFIERTHKPAYENWATILSTGAGDGILKTIDAVIDPGDTVLLEEFTFTPTLQLIKESGGNAVPVKLDISSGSEGLDLEYLSNLLDNWATLKPALKKPKALYTIPTGQNPTGLTQSLEFRKKVYALAEKHDFIIIEDDPYGYLQLPPFEKPDDIVKLDDFLTVDEYIKDHLAPSYLEIDTTGRVLRIETFSKLFAPGLRIGFIVGHKRLIDVIRQYSAVVTKFPSGVAQTILQNILYQKFGGVDGWIGWILKMRAVFIHKRNLLIHELRSSKAFKEGLIDVIDPKAGMFVSVITKFPEGTDVEEKIELLNWKFIAYGVGVVRGLNMAVDKEFSILRGNFFRLTFAPLASDEEVIEGTKRFSQAVDDFFAKGLEF